MITVNRLQRLAFPLILCAGACVTQAVPIASVKVRQFQTASGDDTYQSFNAIDCQNGYAAFQAVISGNSDFDTLIWYWNGTSGSIAYRENVTDLTNHPIPGNPSSVEVGQIGLNVAVNRNGVVAYPCDLLIECANPNDPACDFNGEPIAVRGTDYAWGAADDQLICGLSSYDEFESLGVDSLGRVTALVVFRSGLATDDYVGRGSNSSDAVGLICQDDPVGDAGGGEWGDIKTATDLDIVSLTGTWYAIDQLGQVPSSQNLAAVVDGTSLLREGDDIHFWLDPQQDPDCDNPATLLDIDDISYSVWGHLLWTGQLAFGGDINANNNDVIGYDNFVILQEGQEITGVPNALEAYFGKLTGGGAARYISTDDNGNVAWSITVVATFPGDNFPQDPLDTYEEEVDVIMYNGQVIYTTYDLIDQNGDGQINANDFGAYFLRVNRDFVLDGVDEAWFIGAGNLSVGERNCVFRLTGLPSGTNPWRNGADCGPECQADLSGDGKVDQADLGILLANYELGAGGDVDGDGDTDQSDLGILLVEYEICGY